MNSKLKEKRKKKRKEKEKERKGRKREAKNYVICIDRKEKGKQRNFILLSNFFSYKEIQLLTK